MFEKIKSGFGLSAIVTVMFMGQVSAQPAPPGAPGAQAGGRGQAPAPVVEGTCPTGGRPMAASLGPGTAKKRVLAWADSRNGRAQHEYVSYALGQLQQMGPRSGAYDVIIRTDSDIISFNPKMTDGKTPASGGPSLCNIDAIIFAGHRNVPLSEQQQKDLIAAIRDKGIGFVSLFIGMLPNDNFPEMNKILGVTPASADVHDPFPVTPIINEKPDTPFTKNLPKVWNLPFGSGYHPDFYSRDDIDVLLRKDLSKQSPVAKYTRTDGDYPIAWVKMYGKGKVFVSSLGNDRSLWDNKDLLNMYDEAIKWSLGLTQYEVKPHPLPAGVNGPSGPPAPASARGGRGAASGQ